MKAHVKRSFLCVFRQLAAASVALALPLQAIAQSVELATVPMANSTTTTVKPNLMFVLDDSGSMAWDYMPNEAQNFAYRYGFNNSHCNGVYYNPTVVYDPPVQANGTPLNATATSFTAAYRNGYDTRTVAAGGPGTVDLNSGFTGGSGSGDSGITLTGQAAFYYTYSGSQTSATLKNYFSTSSTFYQECNSSVGSAPGSGVFTLKRLSSTPTTTITVTGTGGVGATLQLRVTAASANARVEDIDVDTGAANGNDILSQVTASGGATPAVLASRIAGRINACTNGITGGCDTSGYSATVGTGANDNLITVSWSGASGTAVPTAGLHLDIPTPIHTGTATFVQVQPWTLNQNPTTVSSIMVGGTNILGGISAAGNTTNLLATDIRDRINNATGTTGYSATRSGNTVTITGVAASSELTPVITAAAVTPPAMSFTTQPFPISSTTQLQNFANWYSYYSHRMLMMKTGTGLAFQSVNDSFRVGFASMNNNVSPGFLAVDTFTGGQKTNFYTKLYESTAANSTPLREILSRVGQYYAHKFGTVNKYTATINPGGAGLTGVDSITVGGVELLNAPTLPSTSQTILAGHITNQINAKESTAFGAVLSGDVVTITGPASALGVTPVVTDTGPMTYVITPFVLTTTNASLNGVTPPDPVQYSCQQNFTILSTDGYWNGPSTFNLNNSAVGQVDGFAARPYNDGAQTATTYSKIYTRTVYSRAGSIGSCPTTPTGLRPQQETTQIGSCVTATSAATCVPTNFANDSTAINTAPQVCITSAQIPASTLGVLQSNVETVGATGGVSDTLADVAMYYYQTDLRNEEFGNCTGALGTDVCENNVFISGADNNTQQHMTTFTLGLGVRGRMVYSPSYLTDTTGDFVAVKFGSTASASVCTWQAVGTVCNWPVPPAGGGTAETTDDLWHAAVNGRGAYFSATDPTTLANGLGNALVSIKSKIGAAAAAATSTLNPVAGNNQAFVASYTTQKWTGNLEARGINTDTGVVNENANWCVENVAAGSCVSPSVIVSVPAGDTTAYFCSTPSSTVCPGGTLEGTDCKVPMAVACSGTMNAMVTASADTRSIKTANDAGTALIEFDTAYRAAHASYFDAAKLAGLSQWPLVSDVTTQAVNMRALAHGDNLLRFLRGQFANEERATVAADLQFYRKRDAIMGDALESQPAFMGAPVFSYSYPGYAEYKTLHTTTTPRGGSVFIGTNDGYMHAFNSDTGVERWAYVPSMVIPNLWKLADKQYQDKHTNYVNGSPITQDVCVLRCSNTVITGVAANDPVWKTILVAGLNAGGRGYYALDITQPNSPALLWEFTTTAGIGRTLDADLGYTFGQPVVTRLNNGTWVVLLTSGYDNGTDSAAKVSGSFVANAPAGDGRGYLYVLDAATGTLLKKISTGVGTAASPSGLAKIAGFNSEPDGNLASFVYGGDLKGNIWRFDINSTTPAAVGTGSVMRFATLFSDTAGTLPQPIMTTPILGNILNKRVVFIGTGKYLETPDLSTTQKQTQYAIKDDDATVPLDNPRNSLVAQFLVDNPDGTATRLSAASAGATTPGTNTVDFGVNRGWFVDLPVSKERVNIDARLVLGTLIVPSIVPSSTECSPGGFGFLNFFDYRTGGSVTLDGLSSVRYDATIVGVNVLYVAGEPEVSVVTSVNPTPTEDDRVKFGGVAGVFSGKRVLWRELVP